MHSLFFRASASCSKILNVKSVFNTVKNFGADWFSGEAQSYSKILKSENIFKTVYVHLGVIRVIWASAVCNVDQSRDWL